MSSARAVVTDRGGVLTHAAIVCRELKKPCVVGTGNATTYFSKPASASKLTETEAWSSPSRGFVIHNNYVLGSPLNSGRIRVGDRECDRQVVFVPMETFAGGFFLLISIAFFLSGVVMWPFLDSRSLRNKSCFLPGYPVVSIFSASFLLPCTEE